MCSLTVKSISTPVPKIPNHQNDDRHYRDNDDNLFHRHSQNIRLTDFGVSAFEVESVTRKREAYATQAQEAFGTSQRPSMYTSHGCNTPNFLAFPEAGTDLLFGLALPVDLLDSTTVKFSSATPQLWP